MSLQIQRTIPVVIQANPSAVAAAIAALITTLAFGGLTVFVVAEIVSKYRPPTNRTSRLRTKGSSRSSGSSSLDFNQMMATSRPGQHFRERRSASFDCGSRLPPSLPLVDSLGGFDDFVHDNGFPYDDIDAAPTPTVPAGPRRNNSPPLREFPYTQTFPTSMRTPAMARKNSSKSARSMHIKKGRSDTLGTATIRGHGYSSRPYRGPIPDFHPIPSYNNLQPAPSPTVAFHKSSYLAPQPVVNTPSPAPKERPGFFRRVFGGGSSKSQTQTQSESQSPCSQQENGSPRRPQEQYQSAITPNLSKGQKQLLQKEHAISTGNNNTSSRENTPVITKKPSSFFRRRKKSITDHVPPPLILPQSNIHTAAVDTNFLKPDPLKLDHCQAVGLGGPEPSPVSSLRRVMKPYLNAPYLVDDDTNLDDADNEVSGSEMLIPDDDATVRRSKPPTLPPLQMEIHTEHEHELKRDDGKVDIDNIINDDDNDGEDEGDTTILASNSVSGEPSEVDRAQAQRIFDEAEDYRDRHDKEPAAAWLGNPGRAMVRKAYMELFDWRNVNILMALRGLCGRLTLKGETQQVDRILDAFSSRWCECNEEHGFMATDVVHTICYSLLLLNTDLHIADIEQKMTRSQFIKNTMPTIQRVVSDARPNAFERSHLGNLSSKPRTVVRASGTASALAGKSPTLPPVQHKGHGSLDINVPSSNLSKPVDATARTNSMCTISTNLNAEVSSADAGPLVSTPFRGTQRAWEVQIESVLKDFYNSIQKQMLPLRGAPAETEEYNHQQHSSNFLTLTGNMLRRTPSTLSKSGSDCAGRRNLGLAPRMYPTSNIGSSRTSLDEQSSLWSPSASSTWSKHSLPKTILSMSVDSFGPEYPRGDYQQSIGFANALSHAIIREDSANANAMAGMDDPARAASLLDDETLELAGAPWAKEGSLKHKHHLDSVDKRSKDRNWNESFAVIQRGWMRLFSFNASTKSMRVKSKNRQNGSGSGGLVVGGGNWTENAEETWKFLLRQTIASALPSPGYSKSRPHVWALSLPTGAVHLFQVGTPEIVKEFVSSANYWSARLSKEPLFGGISNIEYGWSAAVINTALIQNSSDPSSPPPTTTTTTTSSSAPRPSFQSSLRTSLDQQSGAHGSVRARLPADRIHIADWTPPQQSMMASTLTEAEQLNTLRRYVKHVEEELQRHNELRSAMVLAFTPRHPNAGKAMANWERKSSYLLREIVKFRTYIDCLVLAGGLREGMKRGGGKGSGVVVPLAVELEGGGEEVKAKTKTAMPTVRRVETDGSLPFERSRTMSFSAAS
ncbi:hypothetical protein PABG_12191 [Paracoccidioides brasiliensis Pb03]|nr:hypothetical protein PABG_12191 [Paracoccidioides brasiliensis Pb03]